MTTTTSKRSSRPAYRCTECGWTTVKWVGRCGECQAWGTVSEEGPAAAGPRTTAVTPTRSPALPIGEIDVEAARATPTGVGELDRVLGGGLVPGAVVLLAGEPGVGKSTLLLAVASNFALGVTAPTSASTGTRVATAGTPRTVLYVTGEESAGQVRLRAERIGALAPTLLLAAETDLATVLGHVEASDADLLIVDSVQTIASAQVDGAPGGVSQVREVAAALIAVAKERQVPVLLVGHVTKDGTVAGPRTLEHLVDVVCQFEGDRHSRLRMVRAVKNRYGPTDEVGCFDLSEHGIVGLSDPSGLFLSHSGAGVPGSCVTVTLEGRRPLALEIQSLVAPSPLANPRRATSGVDSSRLAMILAVMHRHAGLRLADQDVYVSTIGGARVTEPSADLATALALVSARTGEALPTGTVAIGEVGLSGDLRPVTGLERRLSEAARLGFARAVVPAGAGVRAPAGLQLLEARHIAEAVELSRGPGSSGGGAGKAEGKAPRTSPESEPNPVRDRPQGPGRGGLRPVP
ncbi:DNA repair protein RadA [Antribacter gilvus]|uniref:DNA repair protein RadA n=1 Tax=Antribacter gilvus TaxID=2304675 RepID=UPI000F7872A0|nr:DNA repair protein RadA [Antribacter gilvus]